MGDGGGGGGGWCDLKQVKVSQPNIDSSQIDNNYVFLLQLLLPLLLLLPAAAAAPSYTTTVLHTCQNISPRTCKPPSSSLLAKFHYKLGPKTLVCTFIRHYLITCLVVSYFAATDPVSKEQQWPVKIWAK